MIRGIFYSSLRRESMNGKGCSSLWMRSESEEDWNQSLQYKVQDGNRMDSTTNAECNDSATRERW